MNYQNMIDSWNGFLKRTSLVVHTICFVVGLLAFLSILSYPFIASPNPGGAEVLGALLGGLVSFALINALGTACRYCVWGDIRWFPRRTLAAYFAAGAELAENAQSVATTQPQAAGANEASEVGSLDLPAEPAVNGEGVSGAWDVAADPEFIARLRHAIFEHTPITGAESGTTDSLMGKDPVFPESAINPKLMAVAEFSLGRGFLLGSMVSTIRTGRVAWSSPRGSPSNTGTFRCRRIARCWTPG